jgi:hypothetical protein
MPPLDPFRCPLLFSAGHGGGTRETRRLQTAAQRGSLERVHRGVYASTDDWDRLDARGRHVVLTRAVSSGLDRRCVVGHHSAAAVWGLPRVHDEYDDAVTIIDPRRTTTRRSPHVFRRPGVISADDVVERHGLRFTSLERTAVDVARTSSFADAVLGLDAVLRELVLPDGHRTGVRVDAALHRHRDGLLARLGRPSDPGSRSARRAIDFASPLAENGGESLLRVVLFELGLTDVELQRSFALEGGFLGRCDAFLRAYGVAIELDGHVKLTDAAMLDGRSPADVVRERGRRDRRLLRHPAIRSIVHCEYLDFVFPDRLTEMLRAAGVTVDARRATTAARNARRRFSGGAR